MGVRYYMCIVCDEIHNDVSCMMCSKGHFVCDYCCEQYGYYKYIDTDDCFDLFDEVCPECTGNYPVEESDEETEEENEKQNLK